MLSNYILTLKYMLDLLNNKLNLTCISTKNSLCFSSYSLCDDIIYVIHVVGAFADNTYHRSQQSRCWYSIGTMYVSLMITRDCVRSASMLVYTRCKMNHVDDAAWDTHLPDSQARCSRGFRPSLAESVLSSTYWGREEDLDIEYSIIFQQNVNLMLAHCLRRWLNINPTLPHVTSRVW